MIKCTIIIRSLWAMLWFYVKAFCTCTKISPR